MVTSNQKITKTKTNDQIMIDRLPKIKRDCYHYVFVLFYEQCLLLLYFWYFKPETYITRIQVNQEFSQKKKESKHHVINHYFLQFFLSLSLSSHRELSHTHQNPEFKETKNPKIMIEYENPNRKLSIS